MKLRRPVERWAKYFGYALSLKASSDEMPIT
jgi:hypothetical protein